MASAFHILAGLSLLAALVAWGVAVRGGLEAIAANRASHQGGGPASYALLVLWPFAVQRRGAAADADAVRTGKVAIAFFVCVTVAVAAFSAYSNYSNFTSKRTPATPAGSSPAAPAPSPSKS